MHRSAHQEKMKKTKGDVTTAKYQRYFLQFHRVQHNLQSAELPEVSETEYVNFWEYH